MLDKDSITELEKNIEKDLEKNLNKYLPEPIINSELILFNNAKILKNSKKNNTNNLNKNKTIYGYVNPSHNEIQIPKHKLSKIYTKLTFFDSEIKYNDLYIQEIEDLRNIYIDLEKSSDKGLQKTKREIRDRIKELSSKSFVYRDTNIFGEMILIVINNILTRPNFSGYSYKNEMKSLAIEHILKYTWRFAPYKKSKISGQYVSAFTYISTICFNAFVATINTQNREIQKSKDDFVETQKVKYSKVHSSKIDPESSSIEKVVKIINIQNKLIDDIKKIPLDSKDILIHYSDSYRISMDEYYEITQYSKDNNTNISLVRSK